MVAASLRFIGYKTHRRTQLAPAQSFKASSMSGKNDEEVKSDEAQPSLRALEFTNMDAYLGTQSVIDQVKLMNPEKKGMMCLDKTELLLKIKYLMHPTSYSVRFYSKTNEPVYVKLRREEFQEYLDKAFKAGKYFLADLSEWQQESLIKMVDENPYDTSRLENMIADMTKVLPADSSEDVKNKLEELVTEMGKLSDKIKTSDDETSLKLGPRLERNKTYKLDSQLPILKGTQDDNIEDWFFTVENYSLTNDIPDSKKLTVFTPLIRGTYLQIVKNMSKNHTTSWFEFKAEVKRMHDPKNKERLLRQELREIKMRGTLKDFVYKFRALSNEIDGLDKDELLYIFVDALTPRLKSEVLAKDAKSLEEAIRIATIFDECCGRTIQSNYIRRVNYSKAQFPRYPRFGKFKDFGGKNGIRKPFNKFGSKLENGYKEPSKTSSLFKKPIELKNKMTCHRCKKEGHMMKDCRVKQPVKSNCAIVQTENVIKALSCKSDITTLLSIVGLLNGIKTRFTFDSGATMSIVSERVRKKNGLSIIPSEIKVKVADNTIMQVLGVTEPLSVEINGHTCELTFLIMEHDDHDVLLGLDWFSLTGAGLFPAEKILKFPGQKILLDEELTDVSTDFLFVMEVDDSDEVTEDMG